MHALRARALVLACAVSTLARVKLASLLLADLVGARAARLRVALGMARGHVADGPGRGAALGQERAVLRAGCFSLAAATARAPLGIGDARFFGLDAREGGVRVGFARRARVAGRAASAKHEHSERCTPPRAK